MKRLCKGKHELDANHKFCPTCGKPAANVGDDDADERERDEQPAPQGAASTRMERPEDEDEDEDEDDEKEEEKQMPMTKAEIDHALARLAALDGDGDNNAARTFAKAVEPASNVDESTQLAAPDDASDDDIVTIDAHPMFEAVVESNGRLVDAQSMIAKAVRATHEANEARFGALEGQLTEIKELLVQTMQAPAAPRSRLAGVGVVQKAVTGMAPTGDAGISWGSVLTKARGAHVAGRLTADDICKLETWGHHGARSIEAVRQHDPGFAKRIEEAVAVA